MVLWEAVFTPDKEVCILRLSYNVRVLIIKKKNSFSLSFVKHLFTVVYIIILDITFGIITLFYPLYNTLVNFINV